MTNYLLSIDPSIKNTGFTLWEKVYKNDKNLNYWPTREYVYCEIHNDDNASLKIIKECKNCYKNEIIWEPILITSYNFKNYNYHNYMELIHNIILNKVDGLYWEQLSLCIEQGFINKGKGKETLEHLRGFIAGWFNKLITKDMLVHNMTWKKWYINRPLGAYWDIKNEKWTKETSLAMAQIIISENEWDFNINNHDEADSLLIGWYYLNKENK